MLEGNQTHQVGTQKQQQQQRQQQQQQTAREVHVFCERDVHVVCERSYCWRPAELFMLLGIERLRACPLLETPICLPGPDFHHSILQMSTLCSLTLLQLLKCFIDQYHRFLFLSLTLP